MFIIIGLVEGMYFINSPSARCSCSHWRQVTYPYLAEASVLTLNGTFIVRPSLSS
jgi:hypothetical protein